MFKKLITPLSILLSAVVITSGVFYITKFAHANSIVVDSLLDTSDVVPGDSICDDGAGNCTLRAAIEELNALGGSGHTIGFTSGGVITLTTQLPTINVGMTIDGTTVAGTSCDMNSRNIPVEIDLGDLFTPFVVDAPNTIIKGLTLYHVNDSSALVFHPGSNNSFALCNNINTDTLGSQVAAIPSHINSQGIYADGVTSLTIGLPGEGNVIGGSTISISVWNSNIVKLFGNVIGLNAKTDAALNPSFQSTGAGFISTSDIVIGGSNPGEGNVVSGMQEPTTNSQGLSFDAASDIHIQGNYIGTNNDGTVEFGNAAQGIETCGGAITCNVVGGSVSNITIGGSNPGEGNVISGNGNINNGEGILVSGATDVSILNNLIGTKANGNEALPNNKGISIQGGSNISILDNVISGNNSNGVDITEGATPVTNLVSLRNKVGVGFDGATPVGNAIGFGIFNPGGADIEIGGTSLADANIVGNNSQAGLIAFYIGNHLQIRNNYIGVLADGITPAPNETGVLIINTPFGHTTVTKNIIKENLGNGVLIFDTPAIGPFLPAASTNTIIDNVITGNGGLGIDLADDQVPDLGFPVPDTDVGPNLNDLNDADTGVNDYLNYPVINKIVETTPGNLQVSYYLDVPAGTYRVEFYKNPTNGLDPSFHGEGETLVYVDTVTTLGGMINQTVPVTIPGTLTDVITATATEDFGVLGFGKTSEFGTTVPGTGSGSAAGIDAGNTSILAPANGAYHVLGTNYMGSCVNADNDDATSIPGVFVGTGPCTNDNDGLTLAAYYNAGDSVTLAPILSAPGIVNVWIDYNNDGDYLDLGEHVINQNIIGAIPSFTVPPATANGNYPLRIRYVSDISKINTVVPGEASPLGEALDGEVEDYNIQVGPVIVPPPSGGGGGGGGGSSLDLCLNLPNTQTTVPSGYAKVPVDPLTPGVCTTSVATDLCPNISGIQQTIPLGYEQKADGHCYQKTTPEQKPYTIKIYSLSETGITPPPTSDQCPYFTQYLKRGKKNDTTEVLKWQNFLNTHLKENLKLTGIYDMETYNAVKRFQETYRPDVLTPWKLKSPTGWTYKTTRMKANQIVGCLEKPVFLEIPKISWVLPAL